MDLSGFSSAITAGLPEMQEMAESLMTLTLIAYSPGLVTDANGIEVPGFTLQGDTSGKMQGGSSATKDTATREVTFGGVTRRVLEGGLHIPICSYVANDQLMIKPGDQGVGWELEISAVGPADDPGLAGRRFLVVGVPAKSYATARRLDVVEVS